MDASATSPNHPVTVIARHCVESGKEEQFEAWSKGIVAACGNYVGYLGTEVIRPLAQRGGEHVCIFRFDVYAHLEAWMNSQERRMWIEKASAFSTREPNVVRFQSLDFWFAAQRATPPPRYKMATVTLLALWPLVHYIPPWIKSIVPGPAALGELGALAAIVALMTYLVMPLATRVLAFWLFAKPQPTLKASS